MKNPMSNLLKKVLLIIVVLTATSTSYARRFYVSSTYTGSTSNGSINTPWKSLAVVQSNMGMFMAGDTISFKCNEIFSGVLNITRSGSSSQPIVFNSYGVGEKPKLTGTGSRIDYLIQTNSNYLVIDGFQIIDPALTDTGRTQMANIRRAITFRGGYCVAKNNEISRAGIGLYVSQGHHCTFTSNSIHHLKMIVNDVTSPDNDYGGAPIWLAGNNNIVTSNTCYSNWAISYDYGVDGGGFEFFDEGIGAKNNYLAYNLMYENDGVIETSYTGSCDSNTLVYNKFINNSSLAYFQDNCVGWSFYNNVIVENQLLLYSSPKPIFSGRSGYTSQMVFKNNVFYLTTGSSIVNTARFSSYIHSNNIFRLSGNSSTGFTLNSTELTTSAAFWTNTTTANPANWNYVPVSGSALINRGVNVGLAYDFGGNNVGSVPEIGVYEEATSVPSNFQAAANANVISCYGGSSVVTVTASGGTSPYSGTGAFTVSAGSHSFIVADAAGNLDTVIVNISQPTVINISISSGTITTPGGNTNIQVIATGGTGAFQYALNGGSYQSSNVFNNVAAGNHIVNVKDANGCIMSKSFSITAPVISPLIVSATSGNIVCSGGTTNINVTASGGVIPYTGIGTFTVVAGTYTYTVTDNAGTSASTSISVGQPAALSVTAVSGVITIPGGASTVSATAIGGVAPYSFKLDGGSYQSASSFTGVLAGNHTLTVKDLNECTQSTSLFISEPAANLNANINVGVIACYGGTTTIEVSATGGTPPYSGTGTFTVGAGTYTYTVTDVNGITYNNTITITQPTFINVSVSSGTITSAGGYTSISVNATGGTPPFTFVLDNANSQTSNVFTSVGAGYHSVIVKDANGCIGTGNITIAEENVNPLIVNINSSAISCYGGNAIVTITASGGVAPYTGTGNYSAAAGLRNYTVMDASGQSRTVNITISQPTELVATAIAQGEITTTGGTTAVTVNASGGTPIYKYSIDGGPFQTTNKFRSVSAGTHYITVKDLNECVKIITFTIGQIETSGFTLNLIGKSDIICRGGNNGQIEVQAIGGRSPYQYSIGNGTYGINNRFFNLIAGVYRIKAKDANGNVAEIIVSIQDGRRRCTTGKTTAIEGERLTIAVNAFPNPTSSRFNVKVEPVTEELILLEVLDIYGKKVYKEKGDAYKEFHFGDNFKAGVYFLRVKQGELTSTVKLVKM